MSHEHVVADLVRAVRSGALTADAVALEARKFAETADQLLPRDRAAPTGATVGSSLTERRLPMTSCYTPPRRPQSSSPE